MQDSKPEPTKPRFGEPLKFLPVAFICFNVGILWYIHMAYHCIPLLLEGQGLRQTIIFNFVTLMLVICYVRCVLTHPGTIPDKEAAAAAGQLDFECGPPDALAIESASTKNEAQEVKRSGDRRHCKWCAKYKPDRCHHCRVCRTCVLRMDHHCPWIYNCVGFGNHKYFFLLLCYSAIACHIIMWTMPASLKAATSPETPFFKMFLLLFGETLAIFLGLMVTLFFCFHIWLMLKAMTTIEFCEKSMKRTGYDSNAYDRGLYGNIRAVLGEHALLWLLPCSPPAGDGFVFINEEAPLLQLRSKDMEAGRDMRKKMHETGGQKQRGKKGGMAGTGESAGSDASSDNELDPAKPFEELRPRNSRYES